MPTLILLDVSLSMFRPVPTNDNSETHTRLSLACVAINSFLDYLSLHTKLEYVALMQFSSKYELLEPFTREFDTIRSKLSNLDEGDKTCLENALHGANQLILNEWGHQTPVQIILITDGSCGTGPIGRNKIAAELPLPPNFPARIHILPIATAHEPSLQYAMPLYQKIVELASSSANGNAPINRGIIYCPDQLSVAGVSSTMARLSEQQYAPVIVTIKCGSLEARARLFPPPLPTMPMDKVINIVGFLSNQDLGTPITLSRHLIIPLPPANTTPPSRDSFDNKNAGKDGTNSESGMEDDTSDATKIPNFCVLLHGALKVENMSAVVSLGNGWGALGAWGEGGRARRSALLLGALAGQHAAPWLGPLSQLGPAPTSGTADSLPLKAVRSYAGGGGGAWSRPPGLLADVQKVLRHSRKLPEKTSHLYKELNRLRRAALALGFGSLILSVASALERECAALNGGGGGGAEFAQLAHAAAALRDPRARLDPTYHIHPKP